MTRGMVIGLIMLAAGPSGPVFAQDARPLRLEGLYLFQTNAQRDGAPVCNEAWAFGADGTMLVESGEERVRKRYRTETDRDGQWLVSETLETNGAPDCMGQTTPTVTPGERRVYLLPMNDGTIQTCPPPRHMADGAPFIGNCYGWMLLASEAG